MKTVLIYGCGNAFDETIDVKEFDSKDILLEFINANTHIRMSANDSDHYKYRGIPLTEEWLVKFGFETIDAETDFMEFAKEYEEGSHKFSICNDGGLNGMEDNPFYYSTEGQIKGWVNTFKREIKYVHQLQNLYFALTGEELIINL